MSRAEQRAAKIAEWAKDDLAEARAFARNATFEQQHIARQMARDAKKRHAKAHRRIGRAICREWDD